MRRPTISDIARECGVSPTTVSFALNGRPGVSARRREAVLAKAAELGWTPSVAARALSTSRVGAIGLIIALPTATISRDAFYMQLIAGIESELQSGPDALVLKVVAALEDELTAIRAWSAEGRVDAIVLVNPREDDPRPALARELGMRCVFVGDVREWPGASGVMVDDAATTELLLTDLAALGCRRLVSLHRPSPYRHGRERLRALAAADAAGRMSVLSAALPGEGAGAPEELVGEIDRVLRGLAEASAADDPRAGRPDAVVAEDEQIALALLAALEARGLRAGADVGVVCWETTAGLVLRAPAISTLDRDPMVLGAAAVRVLRRLEAGEQSVIEELEPSRLVVRASLRPADG